MARSGLTAPVDWRAAKGRGECSLVWLIEQVLDGVRSELS
jgi:hypothetical protein